MTPAAGALEGMPDPAPLRLHTHQGQSVVLSGKWVLFRFDTALQHGFPNLTGHRGRQTVRDAVVDLHGLRNRIAHHEPIPLSTWRVATTRPSRSPATSRREPADGSAASPVFPRSWTGVPSLPTATVHKGRSVNHGDCEAPPSRCTSGTAGQGPRVPRQPACRDPSRDLIVWIRLDARSRIRDDGSVGLPSADDETFHRAAELVGALAAQHGLSEVRLGQYSGELVVTVSADRDYFDLVRFEMELENLLRELRARVRVVSGGAPGARARGPLRQDNAAA